MVSPSVTTAVSPSRQNPAEKNTDMVQRKEFIAPKSTLRSLSLGTAKRKNPPSRERVSQAIALVRARQAAGKPSIFQPSSGRPAKIDKSRASDAAGSEAEEEKAGKKSQTSSKSLYRSSRARTGNLNRRGGARRRVTTTGSTAVDPVDASAGKSGALKGAKKTTTAPRSVREPLSESPRKNKSLSPPSSPKSPNKRVGSPTSPCGPDGQKIATATSPTRSMSPHGTFFRNIFASRASDPGTLLVPDLTNPSSRDQENISGTQLSTSKDLLEDPSDPDAPANTSEKAEEQDDSVTMPLNAIDDLVPTISHDKSNVLESQASTDVSDVASSLLSNASVDQAVLADVGRFIDALKEKETTEKGSLVEDYLLPDVPVVDRKRTTGIPLLPKSEKRTNPAAGEMAVRTDISKIIDSVATTNVAKNVPVEEDEEVLSDSSDEESVPEETIAGIGAFIDALQKKPHPVKAQDVPDGAGQKLYLSSSDDSSDDESTGVSPETEEQLSAFIASVEDISVKEEWQEEQLHATVEKENDPPLSDSPTVDLSRPSGATVEEDGTSQNMTTGNQVDTSTSKDSWVFSQVSQDSSEQNRCTVDNRGTEGEHTSENNVVTNDCHGDRTNGVDNSGGMVKGQDSASRSVNKSADQTDSLPETCGEASSRGFLSTSPVNSTLIGEDILRGSQTSEASVLHAMEEAAGSSCQRKGAVEDIVEHKTSSVEIETKESSDEMAPLDLPTKDAVNPKSDEVNEPTTELEDAPVTSRGGDLEKDAQDSSTFIKETSIAGSARVQSKSIKPHDITQKGDAETLEEGPSQKEEIEQDVELDAQTSSSTSLKNVGSISDLDIGSSFGSELLQLMSELKINTAVSNDSCSKISKDMQENKITTSRSHDVSSDNTDIEKRHFTIGHRNDVSVVNDGQISLKDSDLVDALLSSWQEEDAEVLEKTLATTNEDIGQLDFILDFIMTKADDLFEAGRPSEEDLEELRRTAHRMGVKAEAVDDIISRKEDEKDDEELRIKMAVSSMKSVDESDNIESFFAKINTGPEGASEDEIAKLNYYSKKVGVMSGEVETSVDERADLIAAAKGDGLSTNFIRHMYDELFSNSTNDDQAVKHGGHKDDAAPVDVNESANDGIIGENFFAGFAPAEGASQTEVHALNFMVKKAYSLWDGDKSPSNTEIKELRRDATVLGIATELFEEMVQQVLTASKPVGNVDEEADELNSDKEMKGERPDVDGVNEIHRTSTQATSRVDDVEDDHRKDIDMTPTRLSAGEDDDGNNLTERQENLTKATSAQESCEDIERKYAEDQAAVTGAQTNENENDDNETDESDEKIGGPRLKISVDETEIEICTSVEKPSGCRNDSEDGDNVKDQHDDDVNKDELHLEMRVSHVKSVDETEIQLSTTSEDSCEQEILKLNYYSKQASDICESKTSSKEQLEALVRDAERDGLPPEFINAICETLFEQPSTVGQLSESTSETGEVSNDVDDDEDANGTEDDVLHSFGPGEATAQSDVDSREFVAQRAQELVKDERRPSSKELDELRRASAEMNVPSYFVEDLISRLSMVGSSVEDPCDGQEDEEEEELNVKIAVSSMKSFDQTEIIESFLARMGTSPKGASEEEISKLNYYCKKVVAMCEAGNTPDDERAALIIEAKHDGFPPYFISALYTEVFENYPNRDPELSKSSTDSPDRSRGKAIATKKQNNDSFTQPGPSMGASQADLDALNCISRKAHELWAGSKCPSEEEILELIQLSAEMGVPADFVVDVISRRTAAHAAIMGASVHVADGDDDSDETSDSKKSPRLEAGFVSVPSLDENDNIEAFLASFDAGNEVGDQKISTEEISGVNYFSEKVAVMIEETNAETEETVDPISVAIREGLSTDTPAPYELPKSPCDTDITEKSSSKFASSDDGVAEIQKQETETTDDSSVAFAAVAPMAETEEKDFVTNMVKSMWEGDMPPSTEDLDKLLETARRGKISNEVLKSTVREVCLPDLKNSSSIRSDRSSMDFIEAERKRLAQSSDSVESEGIDEFLSRMANLKLVLSGGSSLDSFPKGENRKVKGDMEGVNVVSERPWWEDQDDDEAVGDSREQTSSSSSTLNSHLTQSVSERSSQEASQDDKTETSSSMEETDSTKEMKERLKAAKEMRKRVDLTVSTERSVARLPVSPVASLVRESPLSLIGSIGSFTQERWNSPWQGSKSFPTSPTMWAWPSSRPKPIGGVDAAKSLSKWKPRINRRNRIPVKKAWKRSYSERTKDQPNYFNVHVSSLYAATAPVVEASPLDSVPWEYRNVKQRFLHEKSLSLSRNWFGDLQRKRGNDKNQEPVCHPQSMIMPMERVLETDYWNEEWYVTWQSKKVFTFFEDSLYSGTLDDEDSASFDDSLSGDDESDDDDSYTDGGASGPTNNETYSESGGDGEFGTWEEPPECGTFRNVRQKIGERVSRVTPDVTTSLRRSRWRKKYFPRGTFPY